MFRFATQALAKYATWLKVFLVSGFILMTNVGFLSRIELLLAQTRYDTLIAFLFVWGLAVVAIFAAAFQPTWPRRLFWAVVFAASTATAVGYSSISGSDFTVFDVVSLWNVRHEAGRAADFYGWHLVASVSLVLAGGLLAIAFPAPLKSAAVRRWTGRLVLLPVLPFAAIALIVAVKAGGGYQAMPRQFSPLSITAVAATKIATQESYVRGQVTWAPKPEARVKSIVYLVDESIRADYLDFSPGNPFTPDLAALKAKFVNFGPAASGGNCSHYSNVILRSGARRDDLIASVNTNPFIWTYAKKAGYRTVFVDAQGAILKDPGRLTNFMTMAEVRDIDRYVSLNYVTPDQGDFELLRIIAEELKGDQPVFLYANKNGAHFPYDAAYPATEANFGPTMTEAGTDDTMHRIASYRNAILWSVDKFFTSLFRDVDLGDAAVIYTSDHGQAISLGKLTHCSIDNPDPRQGLVPLLAYASDPGLKARLEDGARAVQGRASHFTIAPAILEMMGYAATDIASYYKESLFTQPAAAPAFTSGDIFGLFSNEVHWHSIDLAQDYLEPEAIKMQPHAPKTASVAQ
ncbi:MAG: sulfatase-like hydrolase/transferase [Parvibaculaceae bacterium]